MLRRTRLPDPPWVSRVAAARTRLIDASGDRSMGEVVDRVTTDLRRAEADLAALRQAVHQLNPDHAMAELKVALRNRLDPTSVDTPLIATLRRRHETANAMQNRIEDLEAHIEATLVDLDVLAARAVEVKLLRGSAERLGFEAELERLRVDSDALTAAHREIEAL